MKNSSSPFQIKWPKKNPNKNDNKEAEFKFCKRPFLFFAKCSISNFFLFFPLNYLPKGNSVRFLSAVRFPGKHLSNQWSESSSSGDIVQTPNTQSLLENQNKKPSIKIKLQVLQGGNLTISFNQENKLLRSFFEISLHK